MTIDECIKHCEEVAEEKENEGKLLCQSEGASIGCLTCASEHRQVAEWLKELKELRREHTCIKCRYSSYGFSDHPCSVCRRGYYSKNWKKDYYEEDKE